MVMAVSNSLSPCWTQKVSQKPKAEGEDVHHENPGADSREVVCVKNSGGRGKFSAQIDRSSTSDGSAGGAKRPNLFVRFAQAVRAIFSLRKGGGCREKESAQEKRRETIVVNALKNVPVDEKQLELHRNVLSELRQAHEQKRLSGRDGVGGGKSKTPIAECHAESSMPKMELTKEQARNFILAPAEHTLTSDNFEAAAKLLGSLDVDVHNILVTNADKKIPGSGVLRGATTFLKSVGQCGVQAELGDSTDDFPARAKGIAEREIGGFKFNAWGSQGTLNLTSEKDRPSHSEGLIAALGDVKRLLNDIRRAAE